MMTRPFHLFLALAVALWAHVCCCTGTGLLSTAGPEQTVAPTRERSCCHPKHEQTPAKAPCKNPSSCGRCAEKNLSLSGQTPTLPSIAWTHLPPPMFTLVPLRAQADVLAVCTPRAYTGTSLLRLHCALIV
jgi:hypothetical protein